MPVKSKFVEDRIITKKEAETYKTNVITSAKKLGYDCSLYYPSSEESQYGTFGCLVKPLTTKVACFP